MENTLENKAKFFAQYFKQRVLRTSMSPEVVPVATWTLNNPLEEEYLELNPLSSITDKHADMLGYRDSDNFKNDANDAFWKDELRLLGYAVEWAELSVEEQVEYGWIKLKEN